MSAEWVTAVGTIGTFVVIAASAIAALLQLRHLRGSNQIVALTECREKMESAEFRRAQRFVSYELPQRLADPQECLLIAQSQSQFEGEYQDIDTVANFFENLGSFVKNRIIDQQIACDLLSYVVMRNWNALLPVTTYVRADLNEPAMWENFEYLAMLSEQYMARHPSAYPPGAPRMPEDRSFIDAVRSSP